MVARGFSLFRSGNLLAIDFAPVAKPRLAEHDEFQLAVENFGVYFIICGITNLLARPGLGRVSDKIGRGRSVAAGFMLQVLALSLITLASGLPGILIAGVLYMLGNAIGSATILALAVERADPRRRGKAMATFSMAYPLSYGVGSLMIGSIVEVAGYVGMFLMLAAVEAGGLIFVHLNQSALKSSTNSMGQLTD
jgi:MFS family permease